MDDFFAPPPFKPQEALVQLKRQLRELHPLVERENGFELRGQAVIELTSDDAAIQARLAKKPARSPEWAAHSLKSSADVRRFVDTVKQQMGRWNSDD